MSLEDFIARKRREQHQEQERMREFIEAFRAGDIDQFFDAMIALDENCPWRWADAMRAVGEVLHPAGSVSPFPVTYLAASR
ncbi:hypothetical protein [Bradyrhizobium sp. Rc2d]|uniref:hypothetical protein n=1 Tax=Bradyrhizobium sp. Rc2d TaxID=1855321 RepID=UPI00115F9A56|nr:hypothetical protein [Bradyrhizobium sp. Rc2d]